MEPHTEGVFGVVDDNNFEKDKKRRVLHAVRILEITDSAPGLLGPENDVLGQALREVGMRHVSYGVKSSHLASLK